jgi:hypothetical protein
MQTATSTLALDPNAPPSALLSLLSLLPDAAKGHDYALLVGLLIAAVVILIRAWEKQRAVPDAWAPWATLLLASGYAAAVGLEQHRPITVTLTAAAASGLTAVGGVWAFEDLLMKTAKALWSKARGLLGAASIMIVLLSVSSAFAQASPPSAPAPSAPATAPSSTVSTSSVSTKLSASIYANVAMLHFDGSVGLGPSGCLSYKLNSIANPVACANIEVARSPTGQITGHLGPQLGLVLPGLEAQLGLKVPPCVVLGWGLARIGDGSLIDSTKSAFHIAASVPFLNL